MSKNKYYYYHFDQPKIVRCFTLEIWIEIFLSISTRSLTYYHTHKKVREVLSRFKAWRPHNGKCKKEKIEPHAKLRAHRAELGFGIWIGFGIWAESLIGFFQPTLF